MDRNINLESINLRGADMWQSFCLWTNTQPLFMQVAIGTFLAISVAFLIWHLATIILYIFGKMRGP